MLVTLLINSGILAFSWIAARGSLRMFAVYLSLFFSVNSLVMWHHVLPVSAGLLKAAMLAGALGVAVIGLTTDGGAFRLAYFLRRHGHAALVLGAMTLLLLVGLLYTPDQLAGFQKLRNFVALAVLPSLALALFGPYTRRQLDLMTWIVLGTSVIVACGLLTVAVDIVGGRATLGEDMNANNVARNLGSGVLVGILLVVMRARRMPLAAGIGVAAVVLFLTSALLLTGSRGPALAALFAVTVVIGLAFGVPRLMDLGKAGITVVAAGVVALVVAYGAFGPVVERIDFGKAQRIVELTQRIGENRSDYRRLARFEAGYELFERSPLFGAGTGGFYRAWQGPELGQGISGRDYPHNLFIEAACELGIPGLLVLLGLLIVLVRCAARFARAPDVPSAVFLGLWLYGLVNAQVSGDLGTNYLIWVGMTLTLLAQSPAKTVVVRRTGPVPV